MFYVYALYGKDQDKFYIGFTKDLKRRIYEHSVEKSLSDRRLKSLKLVYYEGCLGKTDALRREKQLKTGFGRKYLRSRLINSLPS